MDMTKEEYLRRAEELWEKTRKSVMGARKGRVIAETEDEIRKDFLELAGKVAERHYQERAEKSAFSPSMQMWKKDEVEKGAGKGSR